MGIAENKIADDILKWLKKHDFLVWRNNNRPIKGRIFLGKKGLGDIIGILPCGKFLSVEVKTKEGKLSYEQQAFIERVTTHNGKGIIARSIADIEKFLKPCLRCEYGTNNRCENEY